jgi:hypothetical protein
MSTAQLVSEICLATAPGRSCTARAEVCGGVSPVCLGSHSAPVWPSSYGAS